MESAHETISTMSQITHLFDTVACFLLITDPTSTICYANEAVELRTGFSLSEMVGKKPGHLWGRQMESVFYKELWSTIQTEKIPFVHVFRNQYKHGRDEEAFIHIAPLYDASMQVHYYLAVILPKDFSDDLALRFRKEFLALFINQTAYGNALLGWLYEWLNGHRVHHEMRSLLASIAHLDLPETIRDVFDLPTRASFVDRFEDADLVRAAQRNPENFKELYLKYARDVHRYFQHRVQNADLADELMQETFFRAFRYIDAFHSMDASYRSYVLRIAHNVLVNHFRKTQTVSYEDVPASSLSVIDAHEDIIEKARLWEGVASLSELEQQIITMKYKQALSVREIAILLQRTENAVKLHLSRARKKLQKRLG